MHLIHIQRISPRFHAAGIRHIATLSQPCRVLPRKRFGQMNDGRILLPPLRIFCEKIRAKKALLLRIHAIFIAHTLQGNVRTNPCCPYVASRHSIHGRFAPGIEVPCQFDFLRERRRRIGKKGIFVSPDALDSHIFTNAGMDSLCKIAQPIRCFIHRIPSFFCRFRSHLAHTLPPILLFISKDVQFSPKYVPLSIKRGC